MKDSVLWANHALIRAAENKISAEQLCNAWAESVDSPLSEKQKAYKFSKWGMKSITDRYFWSERYGLLFTVSVSKSGQWFIQTVTRGRGNHYK